MVIRHMLLALLGGWVGCILPDLDTAADGTFACEADVDCPDAHVCLVGRCWSGQAPQLEIRSPGADEVFAPAAAGSTGTRTVVVGLGGTGLELVGPDDGPLVVTGKGIVEVLVDGDVQSMVTDGDLARGVDVEVTMADEPGAHRIAARALRPDGTPYDNPGALATQLVWIDDWRAHVAIVRPWPGERFAVDAVDLEIEVASLNFAFAAIEGSGPDPYGLAHVHLDAEFPACVSDPSCDCCYLAAASSFSETRRAVGRGVLPSADTGTSTLTAILRTTEHMPFADVDLRYVYDTIEIERSGQAGQDGD